MKFASAKVDKRRRTYVRLVGEIHHVLNEALNEESKKRGLNKTQIGKILGLGRSAISKKFDGRHNMTLETLADLAYALDRPVKVDLPERTAGLTNSGPQPPIKIINNDDLGRKLRKIKQELAVSNA
jgi:transcriptional regulator with XRE-family HTH domain